MHLKCGLPSFIKADMFENERANPAPLSKGHITSTQTIACYNWDSPQILAF